MALIPLPRRRRLQALLTSWGGIVAAALGLLIVLGCGLSVGSGPGPEPPNPPEKKVSESADTYGQDGNLELRPGEERDVYYPEPYVSPPYLKLTGFNYELLAQQPTHFRVRNTSTNATSFHWSARGVKGKVVRTITPVPGLPPPAPVPVDDPPESTGKDR